MWSRIQSCWEVVAESPQHKFAIISTRVKLMTSLIEIGTLKKREIRFVAIGIENRINEVAAVI